MVMYLLSNVESSHQHDCIIIGTILLYEYILIYLVIIERLHNYMVLKYFTYGHKGNFQRDYVH